MDTLLDFLKEKRKEGPLPSNFATILYMLEHRNGTSEKEILEAELKKLKARLRYTPSLPTAHCEVSYVQGQLDLLQTQAERVDEIFREMEQRRQVKNMLKQKEPLERGKDE